MHDTHWYGWYNTTKMKRNDAETATRIAIATAVEKNRKGVVALLNKHGVNIGSNYTNQELIVGLLQAMKSNDRFKKELAALLSQTATEHKSSFAEGNFCFTAGNFFAANGLNFSNGDEAGIHSPDEELGISNNSSSAPTSTPDKKKSGVFSAANLNALFNTGLDTLSTILKNKSNQKLAQTAKEIEEEKTKQAALAGVGGGIGTKSGLSTGAKVGIALGIVAVVGTIVYLVVKKKK